MRTPMALSVVVFSLALVTPGARGGEAGWEREKIDARMTGGLRIISVSKPAGALDSQQGALAALEATPYPRPPLVGFSPLIAITTSDEQSDVEFDWVHVIERSYVGDPLAPEVAGHFIVGIYDSGSVVDLVAGDSAATLGLVGPWLTDNPFTIGGTGGTLDTLVSQPIGVFAAGLGAVQPDGTLDSAQLVGHSNVAIPVAPEISCANGESVSGIVGTPLIACLTAFIRPDTPRTVTANGQTYTGPDVQLFDQTDPDVPPILTAEFPRRISIRFGGYEPVTGASYWPDAFNLDFETPWWPTLLSATPESLGLGGAFFTNVGLVYGEPGPTNPLRFYRMLVDTGAQTSIINPDVVADLSLPSVGHFKVDVCGVGGLQEDVDGYYIDYVQISAEGGALEFSKAPFVELDLESPEGGPLLGVLGMNFFWNRNIVFEPGLTTSGSVYVSDPIPFAYGDFGRDLDVDGDDHDFFESCATGPAVGPPAPECLEADADGDGDVDQSDFGIFQHCMSGSGVPADPYCGS